MKRLFAIGALCALAACSTVQGAKQDLAGLCATAGPLLRGASHPAASFGAAFCDKLAIGALTPDSDSHSWLTDIIARVRTGR